jgi:hypothetical protein
MDTSCSRCPSLPIAADRYPCFRPFLGTWRYSRYRTTCPFPITRMHVLSVHLPNHPSMPVTAHPPTHTRARNWIDRFIDIEARCARLRATSRFRPFSPISSLISLFREASSRYSTPIHVSIMAVYLFLFPFLFLFLFRGYSHSPAFSCHSRLSSVFSRGKYTSYRLSFYLIKCHYCLVPADSLFVTARGSSSSPNSFKKETSSMFLHGFL